MKMRIILCALFLFAINGIKCQNFIEYLKDQSNQQIQLPLNSILELKLPCQPSTGYYWKVKLINQAIIQEVGEGEFVSDNPLQSIGSSGLQMIRFAGNTNGTTEIELNYTRAWDSNAQPAEVYKLKVVSEGKYTGNYSGAARYTTVAAPSNNSNLSVQKVNGTLPASFSWEAQSKCSPVKDQKSCGSCWSFAGCGVFETVINIFDNQVRNLSEQWLVNCDNKSSGCNGGMCPFYMFQNKGAVYETDEVYTNANGTCDASYTYHEKPVAYKEIANTPTVDQIKQAIYDYGPVWAGICAGNKLNSYTGGVLTQSDGTVCNHAIVLVGWDDKDGAWIMRNSWGTSWGEKSGYARVKYGLSSIGTKATYLDYKGVIPHNAAPLANFSVSPVNACNGTIQFNDNSTGVPTSWNWNFGDGQSSTQQNPSHTYAANGTFNVTLTVQNSIGTNVVVKNSAVTINMLAAPQTNGASNVSPGIVNLSANASGGTINWYDQPSGGNLVNTGSTYSPNLTTTTTFYVANETSSPVQQIGLVNNSAGGANFNSSTDRRLFFDVAAPVTINSVDIYANSAGARDIEVVNSTGTQLAKTTFNAVVGLNKVPLNFKLAAGTQYAMKLAGTSPTIDLYRNNAGVTYPYTINGLISITNSDASTSPGSYYYFFYNWQVQAQGCSSNRVPVTGTILSSTGIQESNVNSLIISPNPSNNGVFVVSGFERETRVEITDITGKMIYIVNPISDFYSFDFSSKAKGIYFIKTINTANNKVVVKKLLIAD